MARAARNLEGTSEICRRENIEESLDGLRHEKNSHRNRIYQRVFESVKSDHDQPLTGIRVVDFTTLVPGPMATLALSEAGADVLKIERPGGDEARGYEPKAGKNSAVFVLLNRGKRSITLDLKRHGALEAVRGIITHADG